mgnify:CR=1 FL=1
MNIQWYPGHMTKTRRMMEENISLVDIVIELLDARLPFSSKNPEIDNLARNKKRIVILNKVDLADEKKTKEWRAYFEDKGFKVIEVNSITGKGIKDITEVSKELMAEKLERLRLRGRLFTPTRAMIVGIPNVGKSSFINRVTKKNSMQVGNKPGVTRQKQWVRISENIELLDTPGVLWPKFENEEVGLKLAYTGTIKDDVLQTIEIGFSLLKYLISSYKENLIERYKLDENKIDAILENDIEENEKALEIMDEIGRRRGALMSGGYIDQEKVAKIILDDFRAGRLGRITLESPEM